MNSMKPHRGIFSALRAGILLLAGLSGLIAGPGILPPAPAPTLLSAAPAPAARPTYEVAVVDKSMTGKWEGEREFKKHVQETFGVSELRRFQPKTKELYDWIDSPSPRTVKIICLLDGWRSPDIKQVDVRGFSGDKALKTTFKVEEKRWREALDQAKTYAEAQK